jgi:DNA-binding XRE family transcriptional regulator
VAAFLEPGTEILTCGFEGGYVVRLPLGLLGLPAGPPVRKAAPDEFGSGIVFVREDGATDDCGADLVLRLTDPDAGATDETIDAEDLGRRVAERLRTHRQRSGLTQRSMAERLGMAPPNYHRLEAGRHRPTVDTLLRIAEATGISLGRLVGE